MITDVVFFGHGVLPSSSNGVHVSVCSNLGNESRVIVIDVGFIRSYANRLIPAASPLNLCFISMFALRTHKAAAIAQSV